MDEDEVLSLVDSMLLEMPEAELAEGEELEQLLATWPERSEPVREVTVFWSAGAAEDDEDERWPVMTLVPERFPGHLSFEPMLTVQVDSVVTDREEKKTRYLALKGRRLFQVSDLVLLCLAPPVVGCPNAPPHKWHGRWVTLPTL